MTKQQREQVVELLRCAADNEPDDSRLVGMFDAEWHLETKNGEYGAAWRALEQVRWAPSDKLMRVTVSPIDERYRYRLLEAAQRVEDGEWP